MPHLQSPKTCKRCLRVVVLASLWLCPISNAVAEADPEAVTVREKYERATAFYDVKNYEAANKLLHEAWAARKTVDVATLLGQTEAKLGRHAAAASFFAYVVANYPPSESMKALAAIKGWLAEEKKRVVTLELKTEPEGATVSVDGVTVGTTPLQTPVFLEPGLHVVVARKDGYKAADRQVNLPAGSTESWSPVLHANEVTAPSATALPPPVEPVKLEQPPPVSIASKPNPWILVVGGAITVGGVVTGLAFNAKANSEYDRADTLMNKLPIGTCQTSSLSTRADCDALLSSHQEGDRARNLSTAGFVVGGAALLGTVAYWVWPRKKVTSASEFRWIASVSPQESQLGLVKDF